MKKYCVVGKSLPYSKSPQIYRRLGIDYCITELADVAALAEFCKSGGYDGFNVTIPYKTEIIPMLSWVSPEASAIGAVNTVVRTADGWCGYNTDAGGLKFALDSAGIDVSGKTVAVLGNGGTAKTARYVVRLAGAAKVVTVSREGDINYDNVYEQHGIEVIINTTPVGTYPDNGSSPINLAKFPLLCGVMDVVYNPLTTRLVQQARSLGIPAGNGLPMLVEQARLARDIYTGNTSDPTLSVSILKDMLLESTDLVLTGMPGSGKTSVGRIVAERLNRSFFDTDTEFERLTGIHPRDYIAKYGEAEFRKIESEAVTAVSKLQGAVIATGGGVVLDGGNVSALKQNGFIVYLDRPLTQLATEGRPLSQNGLVSLFEARQSFYSETADATVSVVGNIDDVAKEVIEKYEKSFSR